MCASLVWAPVCAFYWCVAIATSPWLKGCTVMKYFKHFYLYFVFGSQTNI